MKTLALLLALSALVHGQDRELARGPRGHGAAAAPVLQGLVLTSEGQPARGAVVTSSDGGMAVSDSRGVFRLEHPGVACGVQLTASHVAGTARTSAELVVTLDDSGRPLGAPPTLVLSSVCLASWVPTFGEISGIAGAAAPDPLAIKAMVVFDDGQGGGPELYIGGDFTRAGGIERAYLARWNGERWDDVGSGVDGPVDALLVHDDGQGGGPALYVGGRFTTAGGSTANRIARWNGSWSVLGSGLSGGSNPGANALAAFDDGSGGGAALYAAGAFQSAGGVSAGNIARWDGATWAPLGAGLELAAYALLPFDDGSGPALYAAGVFSTPGRHIARWNGTSWSTLGSGVGTGNSEFGLALAAFDDGTGPALFVGGNFATAGGGAANDVARWNGTSWSALGSGLTSTVIPESTVDTLFVHDDGGGARLYAGGQFNRAGGIQTGLIARWDGTSWSALAGGLGSVSGLRVESAAVFDDGRGGGPALYVGGNFSLADGLRTYGFARWDGASWSYPGRGLNHTVQALTVFDDGHGPALYAGGPFGQVGDQRASRVARWDGTSWAPLGAGLSGPQSILDLEGFDDGLGGGAALYATGAFTGAGGGAASRIARWDGASWTPLGQGLNNTGRALTVFDDGGGAALYVGGDFTRAGGIDARRVARWDGTSWAPLGPGFSSRVNALAVFDDGAGPALYAAGEFGVARWGGALWSVLYDIGINHVEALAAFDDGSGPALYAGGAFDDTFKNIARWDGQAWSAVGSGLYGEAAQFPSAVSALAVFDDGSGPALYAGGDFYSAGGLLCRNLARWDGAQWEPLGRGVINDLRENQVQALAVFDAGDGPALFAGGWFELALDSGDAYLARWQGCLDTHAPVLDCPASVGVLDPLSTPLGEIVTFTVTASDDRDPSPVVVCAPPSGSLFPPGVTIVHCTATDASGNQSSCEFPVFVDRKIRRR